MYAVGALRSPGFEPAPAPGRAIQRGLILSRRDAFAPGKLPACRPARRRCRLCGEQPLQLRAPVQRLDGVVQQPQLPGHIVQLLLQGLDIDGADDADLRVSGPAGSLAGLSGELAQDAQPQG